jgi:hypothetical protein
MYRKARPIKLSSSSANGQISARQANLNCKHSLHAFPLPHANPHHQAAAATVFDPLCPNHAAHAALISSALFYADVTPWRCLPAAGRGEGWELSASAHRRSERAAACPLTSGRLAGHSTAAGLVVRLKIPIELLSGNCKVPCAQSSLSERRLFYRLSSWTYILHCLISNPSCEGFFFILPFREHNAKGNLTVKEYFSSCASCCVLGVFQRYMCAESMLLFRISEWFFFSFFSDNKRGNLSVNICSCASWVLGIFHIYVSRACICSSAVESTCAAVAPRSINHHLI